MVFVQRTVQRERPPQSGVAAQDTTLFQGYNLIVTAHTCGVTIKLLRGDLFASSRLASLNFPFFTIQVVTFRWAVMPSARFLLHSSCYVTSTEYRGDHEKWSCILKILVCLALAHGVDSAQKNKVVY